MNLIISRKTILRPLSVLFASLGLLGRREQRLIDQAQKGNSEAFGGLQLIHGEELRRFVANRVKGQDCEDLVQETWLSAWQSLRMFSDRGRFRSWLFSIATHRIQDYWRREHARPRTSLYAAEGILDQHSPFEAADAKIIVDQLWQSYTQEQRELLTLYYGDGLTFAEISKITGKNLNTIKYQFYRTHQRGAELLTETRAETTTEEVTR